MHTRNNAALPQNTASAKPLKWHKFLIYFFLWFTALLALAEGIIIVTGIPYGENAAATYASFPNLRKADICFAILCFICAAITIIAHFKLALYKKHAVNWLLVCHALQGLLPLLYVCIVNWGIGFTDDIFLWDNVFFFVATLCMVILTKIYYQKREDLFTR